MDYRGKGCTKQLSHQLRRRVLELEMVMMIRVVYEDC